MQSEQDTKTIAVLGDTITPEERLESLGSNSSLPLAVRTYFAAIGRKGGRRSRRILSRAEALRMIEAKKQKQEG